MTEERRDLLFLLGLVLTALLLRKKLLRKKTEAKAGEGAGITVGSVTYMDYVESINVAGYLQYVFYDPTTSLDYEESVEITINSIK